MAGLSQRELSERTGVAQPTIARIETSQVSPRVATLERLLDACGVRLVLTPRRGQGIDRSVIRELLDLTPEERARRAAEEANNLACLESVLRRDR